MIHTLILLDQSGPDIAEHIRKVRPEIECRFGADASLPSTPFAVAAFSPGSQINKYEAASWVHCTGAGTDKLRHAMDFTPPLLTRTVGQMGAQFAEYALAYILADYQRLDARASSQSKTEWTPASSRPRFLGGQRAVFFGTGDLAQIVARRLRAFDVDSFGLSRRGLPVAAFEETAPIANLASLQPETADIVILALPNLPGMERLISEEILQQFKDALLINVGRGEILDHDALINALDAGHLRQAVLDVFPEEPLPATSSLWHHPKVTITPHIAAETKPQDAADAFLEALDAIESGREPRHLVAL